LRVFEGEELTEASDVNMPRAAKRKSTEAASKKTEAPAKKRAVAAKKNGEAENIEPAVVKNVAKSAAASLQTWKLKIEHCKS
jgi:hypothetical protein